jgi:hypothetical protein
VPTIYIRKRPGDAHFFFLLLAFGCGNGEILIALRITFFFSSVFGGYTLIAGMISSYCTGGNELPARFVAASSIAIAVMMITNNGW